jgi:hypothetical protein
MSLPTADDIQGLNNCIDSSIRDFTSKNAIYLDEIFEMVDT